MAVKAKTTKPSRLKSEMLETAKAMRGIGIMDEATYRKISMCGGDKAEATLLAVAGTIQKSDRS
jgi:hypothetical protein